MAAIIDIVGSTFIAGMIMLMVLRTNDTGMYQQYFFAEELSVQEQLAAVVAVIESDFRKIGYRMHVDTTYGVIPMTSKITTADNTDLIYRNCENGVDTITHEYLLGPPDVSSPNPFDYVLIRRVQGQPDDIMSVGITRFYLNYLDSNGVALHTPLSKTDITNLVTIEISLELQSRYVYQPKGVSLDSLYRETTTYWHQNKVVARNFLRR